MPFFDPSKMDMSKFDPSNLPASSNPSKENKAKKQKVGGQGTVYKKEKAEAKLANEEETGKVKMEDNQA